jgi:heme A synthase
MEFHHRLLLSLFIITIGLSIATYVEWKKSQNNPPPKDDTSKQTWEYLMWTTVGFLGLTVLYGGYLVVKKPKKVYKPRYTEENYKNFPYE